MSDRVFFSVLGLAAAAMIVVALAWPQGQGARSPPPFGHPVEAQQAAGPKRAAPSILPGLSAATGERAAEPASEAPVTPRSSSAQRDSANTDPRSSSAQRDSAPQ